MPIRKPVFNPPFNVVRASHVELAVRDLARVARLLCRLPGLSGQRRGAGRALSAGGRGAQPSFDRAARGATSRPRTRSASSSASEDDLDRAAAWFARRNLPTAFPEVPLPGPHAAHRRHHRHAARLLFQDGPGRAHAAALCRPPGRAHPAHRPHQLLHARRAGELRLLHRARLPPDRIHRDRRRATPSSGRCGCTARATSTTSPSPTAAGRGCTTSASGPRAPLDILHICDVMATSGYLANMERGPGRHGISNAFFLYIRDPDGHRIELFTSDYLTVDPDLEPLRWSLDRSAAPDAVGPAGAEVVVRGGLGVRVGAGARAGAGSAADRGAVISANTKPAQKEVNVTFLKRRVSATVWELLLVLVAAIICRHGLSNLFQPRRGADPGLRAVRRAAERRDRRHVQQHGRRAAVAATTSTGSASCAGRSRQAPDAMKTIFIDCNRAARRGVAARHPAGRSAGRRSTPRRSRRTSCRASIGDYDIAIDDHSLHADRPGRGNARASSTSCSSAPAPRAT